MYAVCMFGVLNLILPIAVDMRHFTALLIAAAAAVPSVALLTFRIRRVVTVSGLSLVVAGTGLLTAGAYYGAEFVPPAPLAMSAGGVSHGTAGSYEEVPGHKSIIGSNQLDGLRCVTKLTSPGGLRDQVLHIWTHEGREWRRVDPQQILGDKIRGFVFRSYLPALPKDPTGKWTCRVETADHQLVGRLEFEVEHVDAPPGSDAGPAASAIDAGAGNAAAPDGGRDSDAQRDADAQVERGVGLGEVGEPDASR
jgi:hypothetical protein